MTAALRRTRQLPGRATWAVVVISALLFSVFAVCCCLEGSASGGHHLASTATVEHPDGVAVSAAGDSTSDRDADCDSPPQHIGIAPAPVAEPGLDIATSVDRTAAGDVVLLPVLPVISDIGPAPHVLCVMRT
ncbi:hypothetical protein [Pseudonocardia sp. GCM10023141]|uniref:hypothetical protein n=1 Tax=Pseudonocardia sp. GCM10023141 TaxID=3252653 RepID=UPI0036243792